jgi:hypothetical protein
MKSGLAWSIPWRQSLHAWGDDSFYSSVGHDSALGTSSYWVPTAVAASRIVEMLERCLKLYIGDRAFVCHSPLTYHLVAKKLGQLSLKLVSIYEA